MVIATERVEPCSLLVEWRHGELRICSGNAGSLSGRPFPRHDIEMQGVWLEFQRNKKSVQVLCKHPRRTPHDGEEGVEHKRWEVVYRLRLKSTREGFYKLQARRWEVVTEDTLQRHYQVVGSNGSSTYLPRNAPAT